MFRGMKPPAAGLQAVTQIVTREWCGNPSS